MTRLFVKHIGTIIAVAIAANEVRQIVKFWREVRKP